MATTNTQSIEVQLTQAMTTLNIWATIQSYLGENDVWSSFSNVEGNFNLADWNWTLNDADGNGNSVFEITTLNPGQPDDGQDDIYTKFTITAVFPVTEPDPDPTTVYVTVNFDVDDLTEKFDLLALARAEISENAEDFDFEGFTGLEGSVDGNDEYTFADTNDDGEDEFEGTMMDADGNTVIVTFTATDINHGTDPDPEVVLPPGQNPADNFKSIGGGTTGNDTIKGKGANESLNGKAGNDTLKGNDGSDLLKGGSGNDKLFGGDGDDILIGGSGNDKLVGGRNNDILTGGTGVDEFIFGNSGHDRVTDFEIGVDEVIFGDELTGQEMYDNSVQLENGDLLLTLAGEAGKPGWTTVIFDNVNRDELV